MKKVYMTPQMVCVELRAEEKVANCINGSCPAGAGCIDGVWDGFAS